MTIAAVAVLVGVNAIGPQRFVAEENVARLLNPALVPPDGRHGLDLDVRDDRCGFDAVPALVTALPALGAADQTHLSYWLEIRWQELGRTEYAGLAGLEPGAPARRGRAGAIVRGVARVSPLLPAGTDGGAGRRNSPNRRPTTNADPDDDADERQHRQPDDPEPDPGGRERLEEAQEARAGPLDLALRIPVLRRRPGSPRPPSPNVTVSVA